MAVVHVSTLAAGRDSLAAGADGLAHIFHDQVADDRLVALARQSGTFVVPTLTILRDDEGYQNALDSVRRLHAAGVVILAGSDAPNTVAHGTGLHDELRHLVAAGLSPAEALAAATSRPATVFRLADRGRIAPGMRARKSDR